MRHGFKAHCERIASSVRSEMGLTPGQPLDPFALAAHLDVPAHPLSCLTHIEPEAIRHVLEADTSVLSGLTLFPDWPSRRRVILYNDGHPPARQASNVAHEVAHGLLLHEPTEAVILGCRNINKTEEDEAAWLAGALLIPKKSAHLIARRGWTHGHAASVYGVSEEMVRWRVNVTGARRLAAS